jgi:hypothetical protein
MNSPNASLFPSRMTTFASCGRLARLLIALAGTLGCSSLAIAGSSSTSLSSSDANPVYGENVILTATVTGTNPTGTVSFTSNGNTTLCSAASLSGSGNSRIAKCNWLTRVTPGNFSIVAKYSGDSANTSSTSGALAQTVSPAQTVVTASASPSPFILNNPVKVSVDVSAAAPGSGAPTGNVNVTFGSASCNFTLPGSRSCSFTPTTAGSDLLSVLYSGDTNFAGNFFSKTNVVVPATSTALISSENPSGTGDTVVFTATVTGNSPTGKVIFLDNGNQLCNANGVALDSRKASCSTAALTSGSHNISASYSGDSSNGASAASLTQVVQNLTSINLDQQGITGSWYNANTSGQGFLLQVYPDLNGVNSGLLAGTWFTFDVAPLGGYDKQRWYVFSGSVSSTVSPATFKIYSVQGGNFNAGPIVSGFDVGQGSLELTDCSHGTLSYSFTDGSGRSNTIPLTRVAQNVTCGASGNNGAAAGSYLLSGSWYDPNTSGQGLLFEVNPLQNVFAAAWYTFAPNGISGTGPASQRWYVLQTALGTGSTIDNIPIYSAYGGLFDNGTPPTQTKVGSARIVFSSCTTATLSFTFTDGDNKGLSGTINLQRAGPAPAGCSL